MTRISRTAIVTGAGHGIGRAIALGLARDGVVVVTCDNGVDEARGLPSAETVANEILIQGGQAHPVVGDVGDPRTAEAVVSKAKEVTGQLDTMVNSAGVIRPGALLDLPDSDVLESVRVNVLGTFWMVRAAYREMANSGGSILNIGSSAGAFGMAGLSVYSMTKGAVSGLSRAAHLESARDHARVRINTLLPYAATNPSRVPFELPGVDSDELERRRTTDFLLALALWLTDPACDVSGRTFSALSGRYAEVVTGVTPGWISLSDGPPSKRTLAAQWPRIEERGRLSEPASVESEMIEVARTLNELRSGSTELRGAP